ncbi:MAG: ABC transporter permease, partial [Coprococcus sp.]
LGMVNLLHGQVDFELRLEPEALIQTIELFVVIFVVILIHTLRQIRIANPIELLHSENAGEKPPRDNWILALLGILLLGGAYYLAVTIEDPIEAIIWFFVAVIMVIAATYLLFVAGSVTLCRLLQKNKNYYYKKNHFVSVSSMVYRMKRNGAGLASICILCTMVLVMMSSTLCLYVGAEDSIRKLYPRNMLVSMSLNEPEDFQDVEITEKLKEITDDAAAAYSQETENRMEYRTASMAGYFLDGKMMDGNQIRQQGTDLSYSNMWQIYIMSLDDYNRLSGHEEALNKGEALVAIKDGHFDEPQLNINDAVSLTVVKEDQSFANVTKNGVELTHFMYVAVPDFDEVISSLNSVMNTEEGRHIWYQWVYGYDLNGDDDIQLQIRDKIYEGLDDLGAFDEAQGLELDCDCVAVERSGFYGLYGSLFFLGSLLGVVFVCAAVLIMYYKQVTEGYEDQSRFEIMQKVGMTKKDIRQSINSQILTVFFAPLLMAGVHLIFAFPMIYKLLLLFGLKNLQLLVLVNLGCFMMFAVFYILVYKMTSGAYYNIVSSIRKADAR